MHARTTLFKTQEHVCSTFLRSCYKHLFQASDASLQLHPNKDCRTEAEGDCISAYLVLSLTCHQLRHEVNQVFFEMNCFRMWLSQDFSQLPEVFVQRLRKLDLFKWGQHLDSDHTCYLVLKIRMGSSAMVARIEIDCSEPGPWCALRERGQSAAEQLETCGDLYHSGRRNENDAFVSNLELVWGEYSTRGNCKLYIIQSSN